VHLGLEVAAARGPRLAAGRSGAAAEQVGEDVADSAKAAEAAGASAFGSKPVPKIPPPESKRLRFSGSDKIE
jgi:hypothetical protein